MNSVESTDRSSSDYFLFGLGFVAFLFAVAGMEVNSVWIAVAGAVVLLLTIVSFSAED
ncbi:MAG TPA: hypothetical protein VHH88_00860 [Verrucomicrobiae bacterium]|nr:hypothetical protein [Verrucomicrobiae bacterium]